MVSIATTDGDVIIDQEDLSEVIRLPEAKKGFVLLPRRWGVERSFGWMTHFRASWLEGLLHVAFGILRGYKAPTD